MSANPNIRWYGAWRGMIVMACLAWPMWLFEFDNAFTMGYITPPTRKAALSVMGLAVPLILWLMRSWGARVMAIVIAAITLPFLGLLWVMG